MNDCAAKWNDFFDRALAQPANPVHPTRPAARGSGRKASQFRALEKRMRRRFTLLARWHSVCLLPMRFQADMLPGVRKLKLWQNSMGFLG